jgi:hypothetical protein
MTLIAEAREYCASSTGFIAESLDDGFYYRSLERAVNDDFASLLFSSL